MMCLLRFVLLGLSLCAMAATCVVSADEPSPPPVPKVHCLRRVNLRLGCACSDVHCGPCDDGVCLGQRKLCNVQADIETAAQGFLHAQIADRPCFTVYGCSPEDPNEPCGSGNPCVTDLDDVRGQSQATFPDFYLWGDCPGDPV